MVRDDDEIAGLGAADHDVLREEAGALPMEVGYRTAPVPGVTHLGLAGGAARPSTGYAFQRIQAQAERVVESLLRDDAVDTPRDTRFTQFMDRVFLRVLATAPERGPAI
ncbi:MAG: lycopene cyclase family protein, partial [Spirochaetota bacterium]